MKKGFYGRPKYRAHKTIVDGIMFDSAKEAKRYERLKQMEEAGEISGLERQVRFELLPAQREPDIIGTRGARHKGKLIEKPVSYVADFVYLQDGKKIVEDVKGFRTPEYKIKRKMMLYFYGIKIRET